MIVLATDGGCSRSEARAQIRLAVRQVLARLLALSPQQIVLTSTPGQAPVIVIEGVQRQDNSCGIGLSISHEAGLSLAAINLHGPIGVDLMRVPQASAQDNWSDLLLLARDYLGPACAARLAGVAPQLRRTAFASAWTAHEASLKCRGLGLAEWCAALPLVVLQIAALDLPAPFIGSVAMPAGPEGAA